MSRGKGQALSEHPAAKPAILLFPQGEAAVGMGDDTQQARPGSGRLQEVY